MGKNRHRERGKPIGHRATAPYVGSRTEAAVASWDNGERDLYRIAIEAGCQLSHVKTALTRWRPEWPQVLSPDSRYQVKRRGPSAHAKRKGKPMRTIYAPNHRAAAESRADTMLATGMTDVTVDHGETASVVTWKDDNGKPQRFAYSPNGCLGRNGTERCAG